MLVTAVLSLMRQAASANETPPSTAALFFRSQPCSSNKEDTMRIVGKSKCKNGWRDRVWLLLHAMFSIVDAIILVVSFTFISCHLRAWFTFSDFGDWVRGGG